MRCKRICRERGTRAFTVSLSTTPDILFELQEEEPAPPPLSRAAFDAPATIAALREAIRQEVIQLRLWSVEARTGGGSTQHVGPMNRRADELELLLAKEVR